MLNHIFAIALKDLRIFFSDKKSMIISFAVPIVIASFFAFVFGGGGGGDQKPSRIPIYVVNQDQAPETKGLIEKIKSNDSVEVTETTLENAKAEVQKGTKAAAVVFGKDFLQQAKSAMFSGTAPKLIEYYDPAKSIDRQVVQGVLMQVLMQEVSRLAMTGDGARDNLKMALDSEKDPERKKAWQGFMDSWQSLSSSGATGAEGMGGMRQPFELMAQPLTASTDKAAERNAARGHTFAGMAMQGIMFFAINAAMLMLRDRKLGIWARMKAAPVSSTALVLGNGLGSWIIGFIIFSSVIAFGMVAFGTRVYGSWLGLIVVCILASLVCSTFSLLVASMGKTEEQSRGLSMFAVIIMVMLGGAWFPLSMMPTVVQKISMVIPVRYAIDGVDAMMFRGSGLTDLVTPVVGMLVFSIVFATVAVVRMRKA